MGFFQHFPSGQIALPSPVSFIERNYVLLEFKRKLLLCLPPSPAPPPAVNADQRQKKSRPHQSFLPSIFFPRTDLTQTVGTFSRQKLTVHTDLPTSLREWQPCWGQLNIATLSRCLLAKYGKRANNWQLNCMKVTELKSVSRPRWIC